MGEEKKTEMLGVQLDVWVVLVAEEKEKNDKSMKERSMFPVRLGDGVVVVVEKVAKDKMEKEEKKKYKLVKHLGV